MWYPAAICNDLPDWAGYQCEYCIILAGAFLGISSRNRYFNLFVSLNTRIDLGFLFSE